MSAVPTTPVRVEGITINVPVGPISEPSARAVKWFLAHQDKSNWKMPTEAFVTTSKESADEYAYCLDFYCGGHEMLEAQSAHGGTPVWLVTSKGYYHYIGA